MATTAYQSGYTGAQIDAAIGAVPNKADKIQEVNHGTSDTTFTLTANTMHIWGTVSSLTLSLPTDSNSVLDEFMFTFTSGSTPTTLSLPSSVKWVQDISVEANKTYQVSIINNLAGWLTNGMPSGGGGGGGETNVIESISVNNVAQTVDANKNVNITVPTESTVSGWGFTKNAGTITGINMNGASKGTSGVVDLGTVITSHQDISGKADKSTTTTAGTYNSVTVNASGIVTGGSNPTTISGYGITDAYTKTESDTGFYAIYGGIDLNLSETNTINLNSLIAAGSYYNGYSARSQYCTNRPTENASAFRVYVIGTLGGGTTNIRQRYQEYDKYGTYERYTTNGGTTWSTWTLVQANLANYAGSSTTLSGYGITDAYTKTEVDDIADDYLPLSGGTITNAVSFGTTTNAYQTTKGINFGSVSHIGSASSSLGLYSTGGIYIRPNTTLGETSTYGLVVTNTTFTYNGNNVLHTGSGIVTVYSGSSAPSSSTGSNGDIYIQTS